MDATDQSRPVQELLPGIGDKEFSNSFADMPDGEPAPGMSAATDDDDTQPIGEDADDATPDTPAPAIPSGPPAIGQEVYAGMQRFASEQQAQRLREQQQQAQIRQITQRMEPPALSEAEAEEILSSPAKLREYHQKVADWTRSAVMAAAAPLAQNLEAQTAQTGHLLQQVHAHAWNDVRNALNAEGIDADTLYGEVETVLAANPQTYHQHRTDANVLARAVRLVHESKQAGGGFTGPVQRGPAPASAGTGRQPLSRRADANANRSHPAIAQAERLLGRKLGPESRKSFFATIGG